MSKKIRTISFFSGCGGLDLGFEQAGFEVVYSNELERQFCDTLIENRGKYLSPSMEVHCGDITRIDIESLPDDIDMIIGGPPCQTFSASGRRAGGAAGQQDSRGKLFQAYGDIIKAKQPKAFLFENVRGILGSNKGQDWLEIKQYFSDIGYKLDYRILDACDYGIAQHRERLILVGHKENFEFKFPKPIYGADSSVRRPHLVVSKVLEGVKHDEDLSALDFVGGKYSHLLKEVPPGDNYLFFTEKRGYPEPVFAYRSRFSDFLYKADPNKPTKTLIASPGKYTGPLHWDNRYFSVSEYKALQGFPQDYKITGKRSDRIKQIGNSVSPVMAKKLAEAVKSQIFGVDVEELELVGSDISFSFDKRKGKKAQLTRAKHLKVASDTSPKKNKFKLTPYTAVIYPQVFAKPRSNIELKKQDSGKYELIVKADSSRKLFAKMSLSLGKLSAADLFNNDEYEVELDVSLYGINDHSIQTMWNAIDDLIIRSSSFHSLFEIYGHFTEPHPDFKVNNFKAYSEEPICAFAEFASNFKNCSKFVPRSHLTEMFSIRFGMPKFLDLVEYLREFRFDIRCKEINIAIDEDKYMISYPFTLPTRKQMNFKPRLVANGKEGTDS